MREYKCWRRLEVGLQFYTPLCCLDSRKKKKIRVHRFVSSLKLDLASKLNKFQLCQAELENKTVAGFCHQFKRL